MSGGERSTEEPLIRAWEKTVDVQQHFNDLSLRVRNFAVTVTTAVLGGALLAFREAPSAALWILGAGVGAWLMFYMMDAGWYHQLLQGAVTHGEDVENALAARGLSGFGLAKKIREKSGVRFLRREWRSKQRLHGFYLSGIAFFALLGIGAFASVGEKTEAEQGTIATALSASATLYFPPEGAELERKAGLAFGWALVQGARAYRLELEDAAGNVVLSAVLPRSRGSFVVAPDMVEGGRRELRWRALPLDEVGTPTHQVEWRRFSVR